MGFWEALLFVFAVMVWVLSGAVGGGWFWGVEGLRLWGWGRKAGVLGGFAFCFCCNGLGFVGCGGGWVGLGR